MANQYVRDYDAQQVRTGMMAVIVTGGFNQAHRQLKQLGWERTPSTDTLRDWCQRIFADDYQRLVEEYRPKMDEAAADQARKLVQLSGEAEQRVVESLVERLESADGTADAQIERAVDELIDGKIDRDTALERIIKASKARLEPKDLALILKNVTLSKGINIDKTAFIEGRPTQIVQHVSAEETLATLRGMGRVVDATVVEPAKELPS